LYDFDGLLSVAGCRLPVTGYRLPVTGCQLPGAGYQEIQNNNSEIPEISKRFRVFPGDRKPET
jgi:hypothetical protein